ncbi:1-phosphofructokinase [Niallia sp. JL1B1071]|uniref:1-phosphofructokinase n=1 Tax=Niallia tiangongensis TaxID=3237105 RepID=UPI0037DCD300
MIYTLTLNPSVDYIIEVPEVHLGELNRLEKTSKFAGGKGINVSKVLKRMGVQSKALGFVGGFTGSFIESQLLAEKIDTDFVKVEEDTRINVKLKADKETELNASGPTISAEKFQELKDKISSLTSDDLLVLAGSVPSTLPKTTYEELVKICHENNVSFVVDAEGELLKAVLPYNPFLIKPNHHELGDLFGTTITNAQDAIPYGKKLLEMGAQNVIVSLAGEGAILISQHEELISTVPKGEMKSSVGAGDSMVAGFLAKYEETQDMKESFRYSIAAGSATAFSIGLCTKEKVESLLPQVQLQS